MVLYKQIHYNLSKFRYIDNSLYRFIVDHIYELVNNN